ncbi:hypothetical protein GQ43DRAFT_448996 [Delitschia confertaspora ATCC 74209]|uniref:Heterokaryon incompatibility domain-containing protein n=1 Tax=Delitschia confertaspora ATCC 74209 TaxID=1513339 RepID=A0A9P4JKR3_9PLEO|nr:hypothetical protein GQ43DRAFT_448996 [Delitschia confertaspora ATCC 74209]
MIISACQQARQDNLAYVWIDTCCIDKSSSAELSEAINSMWRYYERSAMCYAYLDDVDVFDPLRGGHGVSNASDGSSEELTSKQVDLIDEKDLARSRWFTRGWTLQELIAPARVAFYIKGWNFVGYKATMGRKLERITGIGTEILMEHWPKLDTVSVARRMSWAAKRETTRVEDMAYCLLGIFDVNMPLLYGEGEKAFVRLQEEIMKDSDDHRSEEDVSDIAA